MNAPATADIERELMQLLQAQFDAAQAEPAAALTATARVVGELALESVAVVQFCMAVGSHYRRKFPFQDLVFRDLKFQDFTIRDMAAFVARHLAAPG